MAVVPLLITQENITTARNSELYLKKKLAEIQNQLHNCIIKIDSEDKRQVSSILSLESAFRLNFNAQRRNVQVPGQAKSRVGKARKRLSEKSKENRIRHRTNIAKAQLANSENLPS